jgi:hypothetical protein
MPATRFLGLYFLLLLYDGLLPLGPLGKPHPSRCQIDRLSPHCGVVGQPRLFQALPGAPTVFIRFHGQSVDAKALRTTTTSLCQRFQKSFY